MENRIRLSLMGLSYNPMQDGAFAILMAAEGSNKRIPIIIGAAEAQAIAIVIEHINPPRPMTHDLFATMSHAFGIELKEVFIYSFEDGIFSAEMTFSDGTRQITLDSRSSDAIAIAIRTGAPIYTTPAILDETGIELVEVDNKRPSANDDNDDGADDDETIEIEINNDDIESVLTEEDYVRMDDEELQRAFEDALANDDYESAAVIRQIMDRRKENE